MTINRFEKLRKEMEKINVNMFYDFTNKKVVLIHKKFTSKFNIEFLEKLSDEDFIRAVNIHISI